MRKSKADLIYLNDIAALDRSDGGNCECMTMSRKVRYSDSNCALNSLPMVMIVNVKILIDKPISSLSLDLFLRPDSIIVTKFVKLWPRKMIINLEW